ncbi:MAG: DUF748 domain-containing protein [Deltaproteobacteria bacterium]|nr:DUF748 domain-containing protein [Deltaproteobacteria bacterium]
MICGAFLFYTLFGFFILPAIVRSQLEKKLTQALHRTTSVREVKINPYTLQATVNGFAVQEPNGPEPFVSFDSLQFNLQAISLFKRAVIVRSFSLINPYCRIVFHKDQRFNFSDLLAADAPAGEKKEKEEEKGRGLLFSINNIELSGGKIDFLDQAKDVSHQLSALHVAFPFLSNLPYEVEIFTKPAFTATLNDTTFDMHGESIPFHKTRQSELNVNFTAIDLTHYLPYLPDNLNFSVKQGLLDLDVALSFMQHEDGNPAIKIQGRAGLRDVVMVDGQQQPLLSFTELAVDIERAHILRREFHLSRIFWKNPELHVQRQADGRFSLADLVGAAQGEGSLGPAPTPGPALLLDVAEATVEAGTVHFTDLTRSAPFQTTVAPVHLQVKNFSTNRDKSADYTLTLATESGENLQVDGAFSLAPLHVAADAGVENISVAKYRPYYEKGLRAELAAEKLRARAHVDYTAADSALLVSGLEIEAGGFAASGPDGKDRIVVPEFLVSDGALNVQEKTVVIGKCTSKGAVIPLTLRRDGTLNVRDFLAPAGADPASPGARKEEGGKERPAEWQVLVKAIDVAEYGVTFTDQGPARPVVLAMDGLHLAVENVTNRQGEKCALDLSLRLNKTGKVKVRGTAALSPLDVRLDLDLAALPLQAVQPYIDDRLHVAIGGGQGGAKGALTIARNKAGKLAASYLGEVSSRKFFALDKREGGKLLAWDELLARNLKVETEPLRVAADEVFLGGLGSSVYRSQQGVLNLSTLVVEGREGKQRQEPSQEPSQEPKAAGKTAPDIRIGQVRLANGRVAFSDRSVTPHFATTLQDIQGRVKGLSSGKDVAADIQITALLDQHSPVKLTGSIKPWQDFYTDITAEFTGIELNPASPYTLKYIGYPLTKGKLNLNLHYVVENGILTSQNNAFVDQITLGDYVESETAVNLPVQLAIALLKNRQGEIDLNIPVSGRLDDPQFSVVRVVFKALYNLLVKAATAPFSLLGALFEGGGEKQYARFPPGLAEIDAADTEKLTKLAKVLYDRPSIKVELTGQSDPAVDSPQLARIRFERLLKVQKMQDLAGEQAAVTDVDALEIAADEYERYLKKAYKAAEFERPKNILGLLKDIPSAEMEKLLYEHIVITDDDLRDLAIQRADAVRNSLVEQGPVEAERVFLVEPRIGPVDKDKEGMGVEIKVK